MSELVDWASIDSPRKPESKFFRMTDEGVYKFRLIGKPKIVYKAMIDKSDGTKLFMYVTPKMAGALGSTAKERLAINILDRSDMKVKIAEFPLSVARQFREITEKVMAYRRRHARKGSFDPGGFVFGLEISIRVEGRGFERRYSVQGWPKVLSKADRIILRSQQIHDLEKVLAV